jgi:hypothetical protein
MPTTSTAACRHSTLAASRTCRVECCDHGTVHLALGGVTLRLDAADFLDLCAALRAASERLVARESLH